MVPINELVNTIPFSSSLFRPVLIRSVLLRLDLSVLPYFDKCNKVLLEIFDPFQFFLISTGNFTSYRGLWFLSVLPYFDLMAKRHERLATYFQFFLISTLYIPHRPVLGIPFSSSLFRPDVTKAKHRWLSVLPYFDGKEKEDGNEETLSVLPYFDIWFIEIHSKFISFQFFLISTIPWESC